MKDLLLLEDSIQNRDEDINEGKALTHPFLPSVIHSFSLCLSLSGLLSLLSSTLLLLPPLSSLLLEQCHHQDFLRKHLSQKSLCISSPAQL